MEELKKALQKEYAKEQLRNWIMDNCLWYIFQLLLAAIFACILYQFICRNGCF